MAAAGAAFGAQVDQPVGGLDHVQVVLDHDDGVAGVAQLVQHLQQQPDVVEVQAGGGLVQDVQRAPGVALAQLQRQLHALRLAARQRGGALAQADVAQAHVEQRLQLARDGAGTAREEACASSTVRSSTSRCCGPCTGSPASRGCSACRADVAGHVDVGQEVHLDLEHAVALAGLAAPAGDVEAEAARRRSRARARPAPRRTARGSA
jgi:hypothetical protein